MSITKEIYIDHQLHHGSAFGTLVDCGKRVFIPAHVARRCDVDVGQDRLAVMSENRSHKGQTEYVANFLFPEGQQHAPEPMDDEPDDGVGEDIGEDVSDPVNPTRPLAPSREERSKYAATYDQCILDTVAANGPCTTMFLAAEVAKSYGVEALTNKEKAAMVDRAESLHNSGQLALAKVYATGKQTKASLLLYARTYKDFQWEGE